MRYNLRPMLEYTFSKLSNNLQVVRIPMPSVQSVTALALVNTGSRFEKPKFSGIAHFLEHMVFKGTAKYEDAQTLASSIDEIGADFNAFTGKEYTGYYVKAASQHLDRALDVVSDMLLTPRLRQEDIDREKGVIIEEINMYADNPMRNIGTLFEEMAYADGLGRDIIGTKKTVSSFKTANFQAFLDEWYKVGNIVVIVAGDASVVNKKETLDKIEEYFSKGNRSIGEKIDVKSPLQKPALRDQQLRIIHKKTEQAHLVLGWPAFGRHTDKRHILSVLGTILGGNMSSRLFTEVREKRGLCYYVHSDVDHYHDTGMFGASAGVETGKVHEAIQVIKDEFMALKHGTKPITAEELRKAKDHITGTTVLGMEDSRSVAQFFGLKQLLDDTIETPEEILEKIKSVTLEQMDEMVKELVQADTMRLAVIGPYEDEAEFNKFIV